ncbi:MAG: cation diffusion facilitator family transporter [Gemmatimonadota bacterium]
MVSTLAGYALLSVLAALATIALKTAAWWLTGSVGLLSDALESLVNLVAAVVALATLSLARRPPDEDHAYGHAKIEYFASGFEGGLIVVAALSIVGTAVWRLFEPRPLESWGIGLGLTAVASAINVVVAWVLLGAARRHRSIALEGDAQHLLSDVVTSLAVIGGVAGVALTGIRWLDPVVAIGVAFNIVRIGWGLVRRSLLGLIDTALPVDTRRAVDAVLDRYRRQGVDFHALRTRQSGFRGFVSVHVLVPGEWTVQRGHDLLESLESEIRAIAPDLTVFTHLEPEEDPASWHDLKLDRHPHEPS